MHTTDTVDFDVIVFGEVNLELDDGAEVLLKAGDYVIQNGTRYASHNRSSGKYVISVAIVGAERRSPSRGNYEEYCRNVDRWWPRVRAWDKPQ